MAPAARRPDLDARELQITARRLTTNPRGFLDPTESPTKTTKCQYLLLFF